MSNKVSHYIGTYLKLKVNKSVIETEYILRCQNWHIIDRKKFKDWLKKSPFCNECGLKTEVDEIKNNLYPERIDDILDGDKWWDELAITTPPSLHNTDTMIFISNRADSTWLHLDGHNELIEMSDMPSDAGIEQMKKNFIDRHDEILTELENSPHIKSVSIEFGYVVDMEY